MKGGFGGTVKSQGSSYIHLPDLATPAAKSRKMRNPKKNSEFPVFCCCFFFPFFRPF